MDRFVVQISLALFLAAPAFAAEFFVSPSGSDQAEGSREKPFASLIRARDAARALHAGGAADAQVTIWAGDGHYPVSRTLDLLAEDTGLSIRAEHSGKAVLDAGLVVTAAQFQQSTDARLPAEAAGKVWQLDLAALGIRASHEVSGSLQRWRWSGSTLLRPSLAAALALAERAQRQDEEGLGSGR